MANALLPLSIRPVDFGASLSQGINLAKSLMGNGAEDDLTRARTAYYMAQARRADAPAGMTPYQQQSLANQQRGLSLREQELAKPARVGVVESIRGKLAKGEALQPGEQKLYDDSVRLSVFDRILLGEDQESSAVGDPNRSSGNPHLARPGQGTSAHPAKPMQFTPSKPPPQLQAPGGQYEVQGNLPMISSAEEASRLPSGTRFRAPDGSVRVVP